MNDVKYRFSGYQLPLIQLDATGPAYVLISKSLRHSELIRQPMYFVQNSYFDSATRGIEIVEKCDSEKTNDLYKLLPVKINNT